MVPNAHNAARRFVRSDCGAVTIEYIPFIAAMIGLAIFVVAEVRTGSNSMGGTTRDAISDIDFVEIAVGRPADDGAEAPGGGGYWNDDLAVIGDGVDTFVPGGGNPNGCGAGSGVSCSGLGDGTNPGQGSGNNNAAGTPGGDGVNNPNNSGNNQNDQASNPDPTPAQPDDPAPAPIGGGGAPAAPDPADIPVDYVFPDLVIDHHGWATTAVSSWIDLGNVLPSAMPFTVTGPGNPTAQAVNGQQQSSGNIRWGTNIRVDVPLAGESHTVILDIGNGFWRASFTVHRLHDPNALPNPGNAAAQGNIPANPDFVIPATTIHPHYNGHVFSPWLGANDLPFAVPADFEMTGDGNPTLQTANGHASSGQVPSWGTQLRADPPPCGTTGTSIITLSTGEVGIWDIIRPDC